MSNLQQMMAEDSMCHQVAINRNQNEKQTALNNRGYQPRLWTVDDIKAELKAGERHKPPLTKETDNE